MKGRISSSLRANQIAEAGRTLLTLYACLAATRNPG